MNSEKQKELAEFQMTLQQSAISTQRWQCCLNCVWWEPAFKIPTANWPANEGRCTLFNAIPPPHIIVTGCRDHCNDIPF